MPRSYAKKTQAAILEGGEPFKVSSSFRHWLYRLERVTLDDCLRLEPLFESGVIAYTKYILVKDDRDGEYTLDGYLQLRTVLKLTSLLAKFPPGTYLSARPTTYPSFCESSLGKSKIAKTYGKNSMSLIKSKASYSRGQPRPPVQDPSWQKNNQETNSSVSRASQLDYSCLPLSSLALNPQG